MHAVLSSFFLFSPMTNTQVARTGRIDCDCTPGKAVLPAVRLTPLDSVLSVGEGAGGDLGPREVGVRQTIRRQSTLHLPSFNLSFVPSLVRGVKVGESARPWARFAPQYGRMPSPEVPLAFDGGSVYYGTLASLRANGSRVPSPCLR